MFNFEKTKKNKFRFLTQNFQMNYGDISDLNFIRLCIKDFKPERIFSFCSTKSTNFILVISFQYFKSKYRRNLQFTYLQFVIYAQNLW